MAPDAAPLQTESVAGATIEPDGLTESTKLIVLPEQPFAIGVTLIVVVTTANPVLIPVNAVTLSTPEVTDKPIPVLLFVQL